MLNEWLIVRVQTLLADERFASAGDSGISNVAETIILFNIVENKMLNTGCATTSVT